MSGSDIAAAVIGGTGYAGVEMCRLLAAHPRVGRIVPTSRENVDLERMHPNLLGTGIRCIPVEEAQNRAGEWDVVFLCTPSGEAARLAPRFLENGAKVIDLSADFRFRDAGDYQRVYGRRHESAQLLEEAVYGATELYRDSVRRARLVANPGCYAITALLALTPLVESGLLARREPIHIHALNGTSGAGNSPRREVMHADADRDVLAYSLEGHRHGPELEDRLAGPAGGPVKIALNTAHGAFARGIHIQATATLRSDRATTCTRDDLLELYRKRYGRGSDGEYFVRLLDHPKTGAKNEKEYDLYPRLRGVVGSNFCHIGLDVDPERGFAKAVAVTDNLVKGAAGSAIQNMNLMLGLDEREGLRSHGF
ncbi:N-acetyl-gamma-glutamyl-phosphate reductase [Streptomonospora sp. PA3]|uniref:N-acetyl-gamma-glutamyl-phosphate reductase n=1 Tax=Streptomonospora sp. PA3 TaxID=2607326 RepID=UPI00130B4411|nr:N-acetyl-gamma-glutamyl-phosphate reductase [Streptomonospora sp. PA3]